MGSSNDKDTDLTAAYPIDHNYPVDNWRNYGVSKFGVPIHINLNIIFIQNYSVTRVKQSAKYKDSFICKLLG